MFRMMGSVFGTLRLADIDIERSETLLCFICRYLPNMGAFQTIAKH